MRNFTKARIEFLVNIIPDFEEFVEERITAYEKSQGNGDGYSSDIEYGGSHISYVWNVSRCGCCPPDYESGNMPVKYLWDDNWLEEVLAEQKRKEEAAERKAIGAAEKARIAKEKREREKYEELKRKFETKEN